MRFSLTGVVGVVGIGIPWVTNPPKHDVLLLVSKPTPFAEALLTSAFGAARVTVPAWPRGISPSGVTCGIAPDTPWG